MSNEIPRHGQVGRHLLASWFGIGLLLVFLTGAIQSVTSTANEQRTTYRFDFGPSGSVLEQGCLAVSPDDVYSPQRGYGFTAKPTIAERIDASCTVVDARGSQKWRVLDGMAKLTDLTCDYVAGKAFTFRVDLPRGKYDVVATLGNQTAMHHLVLQANGQTVANDLSVYTYHYAFRGGRDDSSIGGVYRLPFVANVTDGSLQLEFSGIPNRGKEQTVLKGAAGQTLTFETGAPFHLNSLMGLTIAPHRSFPVVFTDGKPKALQDAPAAVRSAVELLTAGKFAEAREAVKIIDGAIARAYLFMAFAGHPDVDGSLEDQAIHQATAILQTHLKENPEDFQAIDLLEQTRLFQEATALFHDRRTGNTEIGVVGNFCKAHAIWRQFGKDHPFFFKGRLYGGRMFKGLVPFSFSAKSEEGMAYFREVEQHFPNNKYVRLYLHQEWMPANWAFNDYTAPPGTPKWAEAIRRAHGQALDFATWWANHRQQPDGSLGGGWNDDVELMPLFGLTWFVSPDAEPKIGTMLERFTEGLWQSDDIDRRQGFSAAFHDAEHAAEDQGNSFPYLIGVHYGNPHYLGWNLRSIQYFRNYLTGINANGRRHFRSHHFDATRYSLDLSPEQADHDVEAAICYRAFGAVPWLLWYNGNPTARQLLLEHADTWLAAAMSTAKGKPKGVVPAQLGFNDSLGGPEKTWVGKPGLGAGGLWPDYLYYLHNVLLNAYALTQDRKYIAPFEEMLALLDRYRDEAGRYLPRPPAPVGTETWVYNRMLASGFFSEAFWMVRELTGDKRYDEFLKQAGTDYLRYRLLRNKQILVTDVEENTSRYVRQRWPHMTTEAVMTDRIAYLPRMLSYMTGAPVMTGFQGFPSHAATYTKTGRDFAAVVEDADTQTLRISYFSFAEQSRPIGIRPWKLAVGGRYQLRCTLLDQQGKPANEPLSSREFVLKERGQAQEVTVPSQREVLIEFRRTGETLPSPNPLPDLAVIGKDIRWNWLTDQIEATIHNIGGTDARDVVVAFYHKNGDQFSLLEKAIITRLGAPTQLHPETVTVGTWRHRNVLHEGDEVIVVVDPELQQREITVSNNRAVYRLALTEEQRTRMLQLRLTTFDRRLLESKSAQSPSK